MNFRRGVKAEGEQCKVICCVCGKWLEWAESWFDLDGEPFIDFYHDNCKPKEGK